MAYRWLALLIALGAVACTLDSTGLSASGGGGSGQGNGAGAGATTSTSTSVTSSTGTSTGTGTGGSGGSGSGSGGSTGSGGTGGSEPTCAAGSTCVPAIASGDYALHAATPVACPAGWTSAGALTDGIDPGCAGCTCGQEIGGSCSPPSSVTRWGSGVCNSYSASVVSPTNGQCVDVVSGASSYSVAAASIAPGSCAPGTSAPVPLALGTLCSFAPAGAPACGAGMVCVPDGTADLSGVCQILPAGSVCAPRFGGASTIQVLGSDTRTCDCSCGAPSGATCAGAGITVHDDGLCQTAAVATIAAGTACTDTASLNNNTAYLVSQGTWAGGGCAPQELASGSITATAMTLCCP
jgi:hypothetical protein